jgi:hypothetical protein
MRRRQAERQTADNEQGFDNAAHDFPLPVSRTTALMNAFKEHNCDRGPAAIAPWFSALDSRAINWQ